MTTAQGLFSKLFWISLVVVVVFGGGTALTPYTTQYEVKQAAKLACNDIILERRGFPDPRWRDQFLRRARMAGVQLGEQQYAFKVEDEPNLNRWHCTFKVTWRSQTPIFIIGDFLPDTRPLRLVHLIDDEHNVSKTY